MFVPNSLPIRISNGNDLVDYIEQTLEFSDGELCPPFAMTRLDSVDSAGDDRGINTVTNDGGASKSMES